MEEEDDGGRGWDLAQGGRSTSDRSPKLPLTAALTQSAKTAADAAELLAAAATTLLGHCTSRLLYFLICVTVRRSLQSRTYDLECAVAQLQTAAHHTTHRPPTSCSYLTPAGFPVPQLDSFAEPTWLRSICPRTGHPFQRATNL